MINYMYNIDQPILMKNNIIEIVENIIEKNFKYEIYIFFPRSKEWFIKNMDFIKKIKTKNEEYFNSLKYYKIDGYKDLNLILINETFPFIFLYDNMNYNIQNKFSKNNTRFIFPNDLLKLTKYKQDNILKNISNLDYVFNNHPELYLSDCILFRGMNDINDTNDNYFDKIFKEMTLKYSLNSKNNKRNMFEINKDFIFKNFLSCSFDPNVPKYFISSLKNNNVHKYFLILKIKKEHNIPGLFLTNLLFRNKELNNFNKITEYESEVLIHRNFKIKILSIKEVKRESNKFSISNLYDHKNKLKETIKLIYAESCPFENPKPFVPKNNYKYFSMHT